MLSINDIMLMSSTVILAATLSGLESDAITLGQAWAAIIIAVPLNIGSFLRSDLYEPMDRDLNE